MATIYPATWLQQSDLVATNHLIMVFIGLIAAAVLALTIVLIAVAVKAMKMVKEFAATAEEMKTKLLPLIDVATDVGRSGRDLLEDSAPKIKIITSNFVETSDTLRATSKAAKSVVEHCDVTIADANMRTQRQVARVDGMVTAALNTTTEVADTIANGLRGPAQRIATLAGQARSFAEGFFAKLRSRAATSETDSPYD
ncbi:MAG TPA: hypothetical protein VG714_05405 [Acidobacteriaceae bacterium]|nr:hypothetical protein [Acidobacteriaceae bacterium]